MADPPRYPSTPNSEAESAGRGTSRRVYALAVVIALVLVVLLIALHLTGTLGPGDH